MTIRPQRFWSPLVLLATAGTLLTPLRLVTAQSGRPVGQIVVHSWSPATAVGNDSAAVEGITQVAVPLVYRFGETRRVSLDLAGAVARSRVAVRRGEATETLALDGPTDVRVLVTTTALNDRVAVLVGATLPTGLASLDASQLTALGAIASPAVSSPVPFFGGGASGSAGVSASAPVGTWNVSGGAGYERRQQFQPFSLVEAGVPVNALLTPGAVVTMSTRVDGDLGGSAVVLDVGVRQFFADTFAVTQRSLESRSVYRLGPVTTASLRVIPATTRARDVSLAFVVQHRAPYEVSDLGPVANSGATLVSASAAGTVMQRDRLRLSGGLDVRSYSGITADSTLVAAAFNEVAVSTQVAVPIAQSELVLTTGLGLGSVTLRDRSGVGTRRLTLRGEWRVF
jgi:hypothetical protein